MIEKNVLKFFVLFLATFGTIQSEPNEGVCVIRGMCGDDTEFGVIPCSQKTEPILLKQIPSNIRSLSLLEAMCPHLHGKGDPYVCCDEFQLEAMFITIYNLAHRGFNHCPSCLRNLEKLFCELNCSPNQNKYIKVKKVRKNGSGLQMAEEIDYYLSQTFAKGIYESCKDVKNFEGKVLDFMCGGLKGEECDVRQWFNHLGNSLKSDGISVFKINFHLMNETKVKIGNTLFEPLDEDYVNCWQKPNKLIDACACEHCPQSCAHNHKKREIELKREKRDSGKCLMKGVCGETAFGSIPCVVDEEPTTISNPIALEELKEMCPHLATSDNPSVCCTEDQIIRLNQTFEMLSMFLKECPPCVRNFEKVICHLSCGTNQNDFMRITQTVKNSEQKDMVSEVEYFVNDDWAKGVYDSCKGVHRLGFNVLDHYCKPFKAQDCNHQKFLQFIGGDADHFGHSPFEINFIFTNEESIESNGVQYKPVKQSFYQCSENPHTGEGVCPCNHCDQSCAAGEEKKIEKQLPKYKGRKKRSLNSRQTEILEMLSLEMIEELIDLEINMENNYCVFDTTCSRDSSIGNVPCVRHRKPTPLTDESTIEMLRDVCPALVDKDNPQSCCDSSFIYNLNSVFKLLSKLGLSECRSCEHNFRQILCQFACSPHQNQMIRLLNTTKVNSNELVEHLEYYINTDFAQGLYDSCYSIHNGNIVNMMCGKWGRNKECSPQRWLDFMGKSVKNGGYSPFQMDFKLTKEDKLEVNGKTIHPMNQKVFSCNEIPDFGSRY